VAAEDGLVDRSAGSSPYTAAGARTLGYELADQSDTVPDWVVVPMGNGGTIADAWAGLETFADLDFVAETPRMLGVQAARAAAIHEAVTDESASNPEGDTCADSIDVGTPHRRDAAKAAIRDSGGASVTVSDDAIQEATVRLGRTEGVFVEPACAAAIAGVEAARDRSIVDRGETVIAVMTGSGLKDTDTARQALDGL
jgi:threonine synthase